MATARISAAPPPHVDPVKATVAFGDRAIPRLARELRPPSDDIVIQQALFSLCDTLRNPTFISPAIDEGILSSLSELLGNNNATIREKASEALHHVAGRCDIRCMGHCMYVCVQVSVCVLRATQGWYG